VAAMTAGLAPVIGGMIGPLIAALVTGIVVTRAHRRSPASVTQLMMAAFLAKALFFAAYVVVMIKVAGLDPVPFAVSFGVSFIVIYAIQATLFARLFRSPQPEAK